VEFRFDYFQVAGQNTNFEHAHKCIFKNYSVTPGRSLDSIEAVGKIRFVLPIGVKMRGDENKGN